MQEAREAYRAALSSPSVVITMLNKTEKKKKNTREQGTRQDSTKKAL